MKISRKLILEHKRLNPNDCWGVLIKNLENEFNIETFNLYSNNKKERFAEMFYWCDEKIIYEKVLYYNGLL